MAIKKLSGQAGRSIAATPARCLDALRDVESWPEWLSAVRSVHADEPSGPDAPVRVVVSARMLALYLKGELKLEELITRRYRVAEAPQAFADLAAGRNARGVIIF